MLDENESDALYLDGEVTDHSEQEIDSETDAEDNPVHEESTDSDLNTNRCGFVEEMSRVWKNTAKEKRRHTNKSPKRSPRSGGPGLADARHSMLTSVKLPPQL
ncbi:hypothetical protein AVEN_85751-1 [Araneus ventricosus]|uniref:Uncharacterized protein n=1 Tax=Araneus ventricosus TaxID=182803 RepID=A0A4Y2T9Q1_ARAVE|nr:hypothetical protein AVEN_85751-1 [Araneus ventricosus]